MPAKLLAVMFKYLGDVVVATPTLRALKRAQPDRELHVLVPAEAVPLVEGLPWIDRVWAYPRKRGRANLGASLPLIRQLRAERFDVSIDFFGNDRGALLSRLIGARRRIGAVSAEGSFLRSRCYTDPIEYFDTTRHESVRTWAVTVPLGLPFPDDMTLEIAPRPHHAEAAARALPANHVLCYVGASQAKREWPIESWVRFAELAREHGAKIAFTAGITPREQQVLAALAERNPHALIVPPPEPLDFMLAVLARARVFVTGDTGPLHCAAALGVPTLSLFGPTAAMRWAPLGARHRSLQGGLCPCSGHASACTATKPCIAQITPQAVWDSCARMVAEA